MSSHDLLFGPRLKVSRAEEHINQILDFSSELPFYWFDLSIKQRRALNKPESIEHALTYTPLEPIQHLMALIIGDAVHNLRSALDHLANGVQIHLGEGKKGYFPIEDERLNLERGYKMTMMEDVLPGSKELILNRLRPEDGSKDLLWRFNDLDNNDKHNFILPTVSVASITGITARVGNSVFIDCGAGNDATKPFVAIGGNSPIFLQGKPKASVEVRFGPDTPYAGQPVVDTLENIKGLVEDVLNQFEVLIRRSLG